MLNVCFWTIFGFLTGWTGALLSSKSEAQALVAALAGICGGIIGGALVQVISDRGIIASYNPVSIVGATIIASIVVAVVMLCSKRVLSH